MDSSNNELDVLLAKYKSAVPDPEPSANFMPELWRKIEARQVVILRVRKLTQIFMGAAAAVTLLFAVIQVVPNSSRSPVMHESYVDALAAAHPAESLASLGIVPREAPDSTTK